MKNVTKRIQVFFSISQKNYVETLYFVKLPPVDLDKSTKFFINIKIKTTDATINIA